MAEFSLFWTTGTTGDGLNPYTEGQLFAWLRRTTNSVGNSGVLLGYANSLQVSPGSGKITVDTGAAYVYGIPYENDAALDVAVPTPTTSPRQDRIVVRANWTAKTARITFIQGVEGGPVPSMTQNPGTTYDIPLAILQTGTNGMVGVVDAREYAKFATQVTSGMVAASSITDTHISSSAAIAQSKISNTVRAIDADLLDGQHGSYYAQANDLTDLQQSSSIQLNSDWAIPTSWSDISGLSLSITLGQTCDLFIYLTFKASSAGSHTVVVSALVDSTQMEDYAGYFSSTSVNSFNGHFYFGNVGAGSHTIKGRIVCSSSGATMQTRRLSVIVIPR